MDITKLVNDPELAGEIDNLRTQIQQPEHAISDVVDADGNQYVDLVMEGGGMLGIALVGYSWALEQMGIRFFGLGGTSAGSINALLLAALDEPSKPKSPRLLQELANKNFYDFVDGGKNVRKLIELALGGKKALKVLRIGWRAARVKKHLCTNYGLNKGDAFYNWLKGLLDDVGIKTLKDLEARLRVKPNGLRRRDGRSFTEEECPYGNLVIVAADVTTETRVKFPRMAKLYWKDFAMESPARFARASMAIPFFFEPMRVDNIPRDDEAIENWSNLAGYNVHADPTAIIPETALFVDGGVMSNFPIDSFHNYNRVPTMPTFGVKLEYDQRYKPTDKLPLYAEGWLKNLAPLAGAIFNSSRHTLDYEFIKKNPDYCHLVQFIPCTYRQDGELRHYGWLDFNMPEAHKAGLFKQGAKKAIEFVSEFSRPFKGYNSKWEYYKEMRRTQNLLASGKPPGVGQIATRPEDQPTPVKP